MEIDGAAEPWPPLSAMQSSAMPTRPKAAPKTHRAVTRRSSMTISMTADSRGAEPMETTVPTVTPAMRIEP